MFASRFAWLREALLKPLRSGSQVLLMSSGAATNGSPLSGGYAGAKAMIKLEAALYSDIDRRLSAADQQAALTARQTLIDQRPAGRALARRAADASA